MYKNIGNLEVYSLACLLKSKELSKIRSPASLQVPDWTLNPLTQPPNPQKDAVFSEYLSDADNFTLFQCCKLAPHSQSEEPFESSSLVHPHLITSPSAGYHMNVLATEGGMKERETTELRGPNPGHPSPIPRENLSSWRTARERA